MAEKCVRCGEIDEDRRTLWMACFYAMNELPIPFEECAVLGWHQEKTGTKETFVGPVSVFNSKKDGDPHSYKFFTLRVCKECRADWMGAIETWFVSARKKESCGSGIFVRENGAIKEISDEEWNQRNPERAPVRYVGPK